MCFTIVKFNKLSMYINVEQIISVWLTIDSINDKHTDLGIKLCKTDFVEKPFFVGEISQWRLSDV